jgi:hypothetical protein
MRVEAADTKSAAVPCRLGNAPIVRPASGPIQGRNPFPSDQAPGTAIFCDHSLPGGEEVRLKHRSIVLRDTRVVLLDDIPAPGNREARCRLTASTTRKQFARDTSVWLSLETVLHAIRVG